MRVHTRRRTAGEREQGRVEQGQAGQREQDEADAHHPVVGPLGRVVALQVGRIADHFSASSSFSTSASILLRHFVRALHHVVEQAAQGRGGDAGHGQGLGDALPQETVGAIVGSSGRPLYSSACRRGAART
jgi:hypothetical protein